MMCIQCMKIFTLLMYVHLNVAFALRFYHRKIEIMTCRIVLLQVIQILNTALVFVLLPAL